ncbi:MAG: TMEM165/GDT1 family protein [Candidatus Bathyarchaeota archaeon]
MLDFTPLLASFAIIAVAELGDKTQLTVITLSSRYKPLLILAGSVTAFALINGIGVLIGGAIAEYLPLFWVGIGSGIAFLLFGVYTLISKTEESKIKYGRYAVLSSFSLIALMELGDKTQLATIVLAARYADPILVFTGVMLAYIVLTVVGIIIGFKISKVIPMKKMKVVASAIFILFGIMFLSSVAIGVSIL